MRRRDKPAMEHRRAWFPSRDSKLCGLLATKDTFALQIPCWRERGQSCFESFHTPQAIAQLVNATSASSYTDGVSFAPNHEAGDSFNERANVSGSAFWRDIDSTAYPATAESWCSGCLTCCALIPASHCFVPAQNQGWLWSSLLKVPVLSALWQNPLRRTYADL